jgi:hypothetical protein
MENKTQQFTSAVEKAVAEMGTRFEAAVAELNKLQTKSLEQAHAVIESATRATQEQIAFAEQMGTEFRKLALNATRGVAEFLTPKA